MSDIGRTDGLAIPFSPEFAKAVVTSAMTSFFVTLIISISFSASLIVMSMLYSSASDGEIAVPTSWIVVSLVLYSVPAAAMLVRWLLAGRDLRRTFGRQPLILDRSGISVDGRTLSWPAIGSLTITSRFARMTLSVTMSDKEVVTFDLKYLLATPATIDNAVGVFTNGLLHCDMSSIAH